MIAYHNSPDIKAQYLARVAAHRAADHLIQGTGWSDGKGCAVGCTLESYNHDRYPIELGIPLQIAHLEDRLFELLPVPDAMAWPERFLAAIPVGADLSGVWPAWAIWMLVDPTHGVIRFAGDRKDVREAIERVAELYRRGGTPDEFRLATAATASAATAAYADAADADAYAAYAAAAAAADAAADADAAATAAYATASAADAAADAAYAAYADYAATDAATAYAANADYAQRFAIAGADKLIELLASAPVGG